MEINTKASVGDTVFYISDKGIIMSNAVEKIDITVGSSTYRTDTWVGSAKTAVETKITYKLANTPASYILNESSIYLSKEELLQNA